MNLCSLLVVRQEPSSVSFVAMVNPHRSFRYNQKKKKYEAVKNVLQLLHGNEYKWITCIDLENDEFLAWTAKWLH